MMRLNRAVFFLCLFIGVSVAAAEVGEYASLKKNKVNWRVGPGEKYPILWIYQEQGYPVKILDTYDVWRQIQEADGTIGWVNKKMLSDRRTVLVQEEGILTTKPDDQSPTVAVVETGTIGRILRCPATYRHCLLSFKYQDKDIKGWYPRSFIWGIAPNEDID